MMSLELFEAAKAAMTKAYALYSKFPVGTALRTTDGRIFAGANIEVASYPEGWCAEMTALSQVMGGGGPIAEIAVIAERMPASRFAADLMPLTRGLKRDLARRRLDSLAEEVSRGNA